MTPTVALRLTAAFLLVMSTAAFTSCTSNSPQVFVLNLSEETVVIRTASGEFEPREVPPRKDTAYFVQDAACMDDRLIATTTSGDVIAENDRPCRGTKWVLHTTDPTP